MAKIIPEQKAKQGRKGFRALWILIIALVLVAIAWGAAEFYGESIDKTPPAGNSQGQALEG